MLTIARNDASRLAKLLALMATFDWAKPTSETGDHIKEKLLELSDAWAVRSFLAQDEILKAPPRRSPLLSAGSFLYPLIDEFSKRLDAMTYAVGGEFRASFAFRTRDGMFAEVRAVDRRAYVIEIGLELLVPLFQGAITLCQRKSESSSILPNPYQPEYGNGAADVFAAQAPLLQSLGVSAFKSLLPDEPWRRLLAYGIFYRAVEFALLHEFGHATKGHLEFLYERGLPSHRNEDGDFTASVAPITHQLLEAQADDYASAFIATKWRYLSQKHEFKDGPLMLSRYGFCVARPQDAHIVNAYALTLLFFILEARDSGAPLMIAPRKPKSPLYPTAAYRAWRAIRWQARLGDSSFPGLACIERVRNDLAADRFPHAELAFADQLNAADLEAYDEALLKHSRVDDEGRALMAHEAEYAKLISPTNLLPLPRLWGEK